MNNAQNLAVLTSQQYLLQNIMDKSKQYGGKFDLQKGLRKIERFLPKDILTLPNHRYTGIQSTPLEEELDENDNPLPGHLPYNQVDSIALQHDLCFRNAEKLPKNQSLPAKHKCDDVMLKSLKSMKPKNFRERVDRKLVQGVIGAKRFLGVGLTKEQTKILNNLF